MKPLSELDFLRKAAGCAVIALGLSGSMPGLVVTAHADSVDGSYSSDSGEWVDDGANSLDLLDNGSDGGWSNDGSDGGVASLGDGDDVCGESTEESRC